MKRRILMFAVFFGCLGVVLYGCYPKRVGPVGPGGEKLTWAEMNLEQRKIHMAKVIVPRAGSVFRSWRPDRYENINCTLCHGQNALKGNFHMPTGHLPRLSGDLLLGPEFEKYPSTTRLKLEQLVPTMSEALGLKSFSIVTRSGFGCYSCHLGPDGPMYGN